MKFLVVILLVATALAGCSDNPAPVPDDEFEFDEGLEATDSTGIIRGVVVDVAIVPVAGVTISLGDGTSTITGEQGTFGFSGLEPGTYFLSANKLGYFDVQQSATVEAGVAQPPVVRVLMERDIQFNPYFTLIQYSGMYECGTSVVVLCAAPFILTGQSFTADSSTPTIDFEADPTFIQAEMVWETTQPLGPQMYFEMESLNDNCPNDNDRIFLASARGESPIMANVNETVLEEGAIGGVGCGIYFSIFAGDALAGAHCQPGIPCVGVGVSLQQDFEWFITEFHGYTPPEGWWFINDGTSAPPAV